MSTLVTMPKPGKTTSNKRSVATLPSFSSWVDNLFDHNFGTEFLSNFNTGITAPAVNIKETNEAFHLELAIPGMKKSDFDINVENKILTISSEVKTLDEEKNDHYTRREFGYSSFKRTFTLPDAVEPENIKATYQDGILEVNLPKRDEAKQKPAKRIEVS
ncbi:Hsp20/alpha crystallin family protein [Mangrovimonas sp. YM274]|uniref:Hsp20/alpha crystallin family protein n=1 Tax=Mangrovimonas sp. YM274 TaxID=3070660 RepID=UPI0027DE79E5|nr:Hsp20/alpha crystallin family protein [Mangrovimonas sp. YM274]WMI67360.1 Hsp20/alpha crystallin family protein [Mangrovimonas sp. YM274]